MPDDILHALVYTGKKTDAESVGQWWRERVTCDANRGGLPQTLCLIQPGPDGGIDGDFDAERFLDRELGGNPPGVVLAVPFVGRVPVPTTAAARAYGTLSRAIDRVAAIESKGLATLKGAKSNLVGCKGCGSKVARAHLKAATCPVCGESLLPDGARTKLTGHAAEIAACVAAVRAEADKAKLKDGVYLMVAARFPQGFFPAKSLFADPEPTNEPSEAPAVGVNDTNDEGELS